MQISRERAAQLGEETRRILAERRYTTTTVVRFHNALGRAYFAVVRPFHQLIVPALIRRALRVAAASRSA